MFRYEKVAMSAMNVTSLGACRCVNPVFPVQGVKPRLVYLPIMQSSPNALSMRMGSGFDAPSLVTYVSRVVAKPRHLDPRDHDLLGVATGAHHAASGQLQLERHLLLVALPAQLVHLGTQLLSRLARLRGPRNLALQRRDSRIPLGEQGG